MKYWREIVFQMIEEETNHRNAALPIENYFVRKSDFISSLKSSFPIRESHPPHAFMEVLFAKLNAVSKAYFNFHEILHIIGSIDDCSFTNIKNEADARIMVMCIYWSFHESKRDWNGING